MMKEWTPKGTLAQKLNVLISYCDGLLLLLLRRVSEEESESAFTLLFILSGENGISHSHWTKYIN